MKRRRIYTKYQASSQKSANKSKGNLWLAMLIVFLALGSIYYYNKWQKPAIPGQAVSVWIDGKPVLQKPLSKGTTTIDLSKYGKEIVIEIKNKKAGIISSDCPDKICVNTGFLGGTDQTAVCLPNKTSIVIQ